MSATNSTTHYNLPSFVGSDKPAWLVDWNGAMASIDSAIYEAKSTADQAVTAAAAVASDLATLSGTVSTQGSSITTLSETLTTAVGNINTINGNINTINSLIGNGTPTTTDQTIIGAINEINAHVVNMLGVEVGSVTADGVKTWSTLFNEIFAVWAAAVGDLSLKDKINVKLLIIATTGDISVRNTDNISDSVLRFAETSGTNINIVSLKTTASEYLRYAVADGTSTDRSAEVPASGTVIKLYY